MFQHNQIELLILIVCGYTISPMWACSITTKTKTTELISNAYAIVRARVIGYENPPTEPNRRYLGIPESVVKFEIEEQIKGVEILPNILWINGYLSNNDDYNDHPPPYRHVRPNGRTGSCIANTYKQGAEYLLFLNDRYSPYWDALTPVNEQLHLPLSEDRWLRWTHEEFLRTMVGGFKKNLPTGVSSEYDRHTYRPPLNVAMPNVVGVYDEPHCTTEVNYSFIVVGYDTYKNGTTKQDDYIAKNSWCESWGNKSYVWMSRNKHNQCGIASTGSCPFV
ncbi:unnamed protein product [Rotaria magnacalcarata]|uniref:Peptidase C1A papain C-terminal domain-containing protein n=2 Tax=Rotaria magnacalcarata TaxID=392030 RepID=A0A819Q1M3_9BILA|nr:unnamed protein product [Rotaria magnacalcarata]